MPAPIVYQGGQSEGSFNWNETTLHSMEHVTMFDLITQKQEFVDHLTKERAPVTSAAILAKVIDGIRLQY